MMGRLGDEKRRKEIKIKNKKLPENLSTMFQ
jgi:hypothetical protein